MKTLKCEMCGSVDLVKQDDLYVCQHCSTKYSLEDVKKLIVGGKVEIEGTVKIDNSEKIEKLYELARCARREESSLTAIKYYEMILLERPNDWEAYFFSIYFQARETKIAYIASWARRVHACLDRVFNLITENSPKEEQDINMRMVAVYTKKISLDLATAALTNYRRMDKSIRSHGVKDFEESVTAALSTLNDLGSLLIRKATLKDTAIETWKSVISFVEQKDCDSSIAIKWEGNTAKKLLSSVSDIFTEQEINAILYRAKNVILKEDLDKVRDELLNLKSTPLREEVLAKIEEEKASIMELHCVRNAKVRLEWTLTLNPVKKAFRFVEGYPHQRLQSAQIAFKDIVSVCWIGSSNFGIRYGENLSININFPSYCADVEKRFFELYWPIVKKDNPNIRDVKKGKGCYVATCVYGSYDCPQVWTLRRYRDDTLGSTWYGRAFIRTYYAISPTLVKWFGKTKWFKKMWKGSLDRMVKKLQDKGVENTPYEDKDWSK